MRPFSGGDSFYSNTRLLLPLYTDTRDVSKLRRVTANSYGTPSFDNRDAFYAGSGTGITVSSPQTADVNWTAGPYIIDVEVWCPSTETYNIGISHASIISNAQGGANNWSLGVHRDNALEFYYWTGIQNNLTSGSNVLKRNEWTRLEFHHLGGWVGLFVNGTRVQSGSISGQYSTGVAWAVGYNGWATNNALFIRNLRVTTGVWTPDHWATRSIHSRAFRSDGSILAARAVTPYILHGASLTLISGAAAALGTDDAAAVTAILRSTGALDAANAVDVPAIAGLVFGIIGWNADDIGAFVGRVFASVSLSATAADDVAAVLAKITTVGTLAADLSDDELIVLGKAWPLVYQAATGIRLSSPESTLALSDWESTISGFPPTVISNIRM